MIPRVLHLVSSRKPPALAAEAWCLWGGGAEEWLAEIARWQLQDEARLRLFLLPGSLGARAAAGLFVMTVPGDPPRVHPAGLGFRRHGEKLYLPLEAALEPPVTAAEESALHGFTGALVMHPLAGAVGFDAADELALHDLVIVPPERRESWTAPLPGAPDLRPLLSVAVKAPALDDLFGESAREIGSEPPAGLLPQDEKSHAGPEATGGLAKHASQAMSGLMKPFLWLAHQMVRRLPHDAPRRTFWNDFEDWLARKLGGREEKEDLLAARERALKKLLEELEHNPEEGLRHALPLAGPGLHRGLAPPSSRLGARDPNFNLSKIRGGGPADGWDVPPQYQQELRRHYMELASREVRLGHFRRAAYIYAELLGDLSTAAIVLKNGGHHAEAAILYRDHLHRPLEAAECFAAGGQILEAVKLYEEGKRWDRLGQLYRELGQEEKAQEAFKTWVRELLEADDVMQASLVLQNDLHLREEALALLESAWNSSRQARACAERALHLRTTEGEQAAAADFLRRLAAHDDETRTNDLLGLFCWVQAISPDRSVRRLAEDLGRRKIAALLPEATEARRSFLVRLLNGLSPDDLLLARDGLRHLDAERAKAQALARRTAALGRNGAPSGNLALHEVGSALLPWGNAATELKSACSLGTFVCAAAYAAQGTGLLLCHGEIADLAGFDMLVWELPVSVWSAAQRPILVAPPRQSSSFFLHLPDAPGVLAEQSAPLGREHSGQASFSTPSWLADPVWAAAYDAGGDLWVLRPTPAGLRLSQFDAGGVLVRDRLAGPLEEALLAATPSPGRPLPMAVTASHLVIAAGRWLFCYTLADDGTGVPETVSLESEVAGLVQAPLWTSPRIGVVTRESVHILWLGGGRLMAKSVAEHLPVPPCASFVPDGALIVASGRDGLLIKASSLGESRFWRFSFPSSVAGLVSLAEPWHFAAIGEDSRLTHWRYEGRDL